MYQSNSPLVILIQDAHAIPQAQHNIQKLIDYMQKQYGLDRIALEGASSELDPRIFKNFPDKVSLKKTFEEYRDKGELTGGAAAAIFNETPSVYQGIEDWELYEEGIEFYLEGMGKEEALMEKLQTARARLQQKKEKTYSKKLLKIDGILEQFRKEETDLETVLKKLDRIQKGTRRKLWPVPFSIKALLEEIKQDGEENAEIEQEVREIAEKIQKVLDTLSVSDTAEFNQEYQAFQTSQISAAEFAIFMKKLAEKGTGNNSLPVPFSEHLLSQIQKHKRLHDMEGTKFFEEFETYAQKAKESLFRNDEERELDKTSRQLGLLEKLAKLELSREEWEEIKTFNVEHITYGKDFKPHTEFYQNAERRDQVLFKNVMKLMQRKGQAHPLVPLKSKVSDTAALLVAGGFHTEGLAKQFKEKSISYVVIRPHIGSVPEKNFYRAHMRADVSWKDYLRVENNKVNLYEAFVRGARDKLLDETLTVKHETQGHAGSIKDASRNTLHSLRLLKTWRDQILRNLAEEEKISKAHEYTRFLDEAVKGGQERSLHDQLPAFQNLDRELRTRWFSKIKQFSTALRRLQSSGRLTEKNILELLKPSTIPSAVVSAAAFPKSEIRAELIRGTHDSMRFEREKSGRLRNAQDDFEQPRRAEVRSFENINQPGHDQIIFASQEGMEESTSNLKKISSFTGSYRFEDIDDFDTFDERFPDVGYLMKDWPNGYELFITFGELIYNALQVSKDHVEPVQVTMDLYEPGLAGRDKKTGMLHAVITQPYSDDAAWQRLQVNEKGFQTQGSHYLTGTAQRLTDGARNHFGNGLLRVGYLMEYFPLLLRYERSRTAPHPVTTELYIDLTQPRRKFSSSRAEIRAPDLVVTYHGRVSHEKQIALFIKTVKLLHEEFKKKGKKLAAEIYGFNQENPSKYEREMKSLAQRSELDESVLQFKGPYEVKDLPKLYSEYPSEKRIFFFPGEIEAFGISIVEAMRLGYPVVVPNKGGVVEVVTDPLSFSPENGIIVNIEDLNKKEKIKAYTHAILNYFEHREESPLKSSRISRRSEEFTHRRAAKKYYELFKELTGKKGKNPFSFHYYSIGYFPFEAGGIREYFRNLLKGWEELKSQKIIDPFEKHITALEHRKHDIPDDVQKLLSTEASLTRLPESELHFKRAIPSNAEIEKEIKPALKAIIERIISLSLEGDVKLTGLLKKNRTNKKDIENLYRLWRVLQRFEYDHVMDHTAAAILDELSPDWRGQIKEGEEAVIHQWIKDELRYLPLSLPTEDILYVDHRNPLAFPALIAQHFSKDGAKTRESALIVGVHSRDERTSFNRILNNENLSPWAREFRQKLFIYRLNLIYDNARAVVAVSQFIADELTGALAVDPEKVRVIYNGSDFNLRSAGGATGRLSDSREGDEQTRRAEVRNDAVTREEAASKLTDEHQKLVFHRLVEGEWLSRIRQAFPPVTQSEKDILSSMAYLLYPGAGTDIDFVVEDPVDKVVMVDERTDGEIILSDIVDKLSLWKDRGVSIQSILPDLGNQSFKIKLESSSGIKQIEYNFGTDIFRNFEFGNKPVLVKYRGFGLITGLRRGNQNAKFLARLPVNSLVSAIHSPDLLNGMEVLGFREVHLTGGFYSGMKLFKKEYAYTEGELIALHEALYKANHIDVEVSWDPNLDVAGIEDQLLSAIRRRSEVRAGEENTTHEAAKKPKLTVQELMNQVKSDNETERSDAVKHLGPLYIKRYKKLAEDQYYLAKYFAEQIVQIPFNDFDIEDFYQEASMALFKGLTHYHQSKKSILAIYLTSRTLESLAHLLSQQWKVSAKNLRKNLNKMSRKIRFPEDKLKEIIYFPPDHVTNELKKAIPDLGDFAEEIRRNREQSWNSYAGDHPGNYTHTPTSSFPAESLYQDLIKNIEDNLNILSDEERQVLEMYLGLSGKTRQSFKEISTALNLSMGRARNLILRSIRKVVRVKSMNLIAGIVPQRMSEHDLNKAIHKFRISPKEKVILNHTLGLEGNDILNANEIYGLIQSATGGLYEVRGFRQDAMTALIDELKRHGLTLKQIFQDANLNRRTQDRLESVLSMFDDEERNILILYFIIFGGDEKIINKATSIPRHKIRGVKKRALKALSEELALDEFEQWEGKLDELDRALEGEASFAARHLRARAEAIQLEPHRAKPVEIKEAGIKGAQELVVWVESRLTRMQQKILPHVLQNRTDEEIIQKLKIKPEPIAAQRKKLVRKLRLWFTLGMLDRFGPREDVFEKLIDVMSQAPLERLLGKEELKALLAASQGDVEGVVKVLSQLYSERFSEREIEGIVKTHFEEISQYIHYGPRAGTSRQILDPVYHLISKMGEARAQKKRLVLKRLLRDLFYPLMRKDEENHSEQGLKSLEREMEKAKSDPFWYELLQSTYDYYRGAKPYHPRGFREGVDGMKEPLIPAQRYAIWDSLRSLQNPKEKSALLTSESRIGKTIMAALAALNIQKPDGGYAVKRLLYTTTNQAKYEVERELRRRTNEELDLQIIVVDAESQDREEKIREAITLAEKGKNVAIIINYEAYEPRYGLLPLIREFNPDSHIIDELENLRHVENRVRAPEIFAIPAEYRIGISARLVLKGPKDVTEALLWARRETFPPGDQGRTQIAALTPDELFEALDPVMVGWRRKVVLPELGEPQEIPVRLPYTPLQDRHIRKMRTDFIAWKKEDARSDKESDKDHAFTRFDLERRASTDLALVLPDTQLVFRPEGNGSEIVIAPDQNEIELDNQRFFKSVSEDNRFVRLQPASGQALPIVIAIEKLPYAIEIDGKKYEVKHQPLTDLSPKIQELDEIIRTERNQNGKVVVYVPFVEAIERLEDRYNKRYGQGAAVGISSKDSLKYRNDTIWRFRSEAEPSILIATPYLLGSSLNLFQVPGSSFHISTAVRVSHALWNINDVERLIGIGQTHPVKVYNFISQFREDPDTTTDLPRFKTVDEMLESRLADEDKLFRDTLYGESIPDESSSERLEALNDELASLADEIMNSNIENGSATDIRSEVRNGHIPARIAVDSETRAVKAKDYPDLYRGMQALYERQIERKHLENGEWKGFFRIVEDGNLIRYGVFSPNYKEPQIYVGAIPEAYFHQAEFIAIENPGRFKRPGHVAASPVRTKANGRGAMNLVPEIIRKEFPDQYWLEWEGLRGQKWWAAYNPYPIFPPKQNAPVDEQPHHLTLIRGDGRIYQSQIYREDYLRDILTFWTRLNESPSLQGKKKFRLGINGWYASRKKKAPKGGASQSQIHAQLVRFTFPIERAELDQKRAIGPVLISTLSDDRGTGIVFEATSEKKNILVHLVAQSIKAIIEKGNSFNVIGVFGEDGRIKVFVIDRVLTTAPPFTNELGYSEIGRAFVGGIGLANGTFREDAIAALKKVTAPQAKIDSIIQSLHLPAESMLHRSEVRMGQKNKLPSADQVAKSYRERGYFGTLKRFHISSHTYYNLLRGYIPERSEDKRDYFALNYDEARFLVENPREGKLYGVFNSETTAKNLILATLDIVPGFKEAREARDIRRMAELYRKAVIGYEPWDKKKYSNGGQKNFFYEAGGLKGLMNHPRPFLVKRNSPTALLRLVLPELIDAANPDALDPLEMVQNYWTEEGKARYHILHALDKVEGFKEAREAKDIRRMAELYRKSVIGYTPKEKNKYSSTGQVSFFYEIGGLSGLMTHPRSFLAKTSSPAALLRLVLPELIDAANPDALDPVEVEHDYWTNERNVRYHILRALDKVEGFKEARETKNIKRMAELYRKAVIGYQPKNREKYSSTGQQSFFYEIGGLSGLMTHPRSFLAKTGSPATLLRLVLPELIDDQNPNALKSNEVDREFRSEMRENKEQLFKELVLHYELPEDVTLLEEKGEERENIYLIQAGDQKYILKRPFYRGQIDSIEQEGALLEFLKEKGLPVATMVKNRGRKYATLMEGSAYALYRFIEGEKRGWGSAGTSESSEAAKLLAQLHNETKNWNVSGGLAHSLHKLPPTIWVQNPEATLKQLETLYGQIQKRGPPSTEVEKYFISHFKELAPHFEKIGSLPSNLLLNLPTAVTHGDYHQGNMRFSGTNITGLFDFEYSRRDARIADLSNGFMIRYAKDGTSLNLGKAEDFLKTYNQHLDEPLTVEELDLLPEVFRMKYLSVILFLLDRQDRVPPSLAFRGLKEQFANLRILDSQNWMELKKSIRPSRSEIRNETDAQERPPLSARQKQEIMEFVDKLLAGDFSKGLPKDEQQRLLMLLEVIHGEKMKPRWKNEIATLIERIQKGKILKQWEFARLVQILTDHFMKENPWSTQSATGHIVMMKPPILYDIDFVDQLFISNESPLAEWEKKLIDMRYGIVHFLNPVSLAEIAKHKELAEARGAAYSRIFTEIPNDVRAIENKAAGFHKTYLAKLKESEDASRSGIRARPVEIRHVNLSQLNEAKKEKLLRQIFRIHLHSGWDFSALNRDLQKEIRDANPADHLILAINTQNRPVGYAWLTHDTGSNEAHFYVIAVKKMLHRTGIGSLLADQVVRYSRENGIEALGVGIDLSNHRSIDFFDRFIKQYQAEIISMEMHGVDKKVQSRAGESLAVFADRVTTGQELGPDSIPGGFLDIVLRLKSPRLSRSEVRGGKPWKRPDPELVAQSYKTTGYFDTLASLRLTPRRYASMIDQYLEESAEKGVDYFALTYAEAQHLIENRNIRKPFRTLNSKQTARNLIYATLDTIPGFKTARENEDVKTMAALYRKYVIQYKAEGQITEDGQRTFFREKGGLLGLMHRRPYLKKSGSAAALLRFALPKLIDLRNPDALDPLEVERDYWTDPENAKYHILLALDAIPGFTEAREKNQIKTMADLYRQYVIPYQPNNREKYPRGGQQAFFYEKGGLSGLMTPKRAFLTKRGSPAALLRFVLRSLIDVRNPDALDPHEIESGYWDDSENAKYHILLALYAIPGFQEAHEEGRIKEMADLYRRYVIKYEPRDKQKYSQGGQLTFFQETGGLATLLGYPRKFLGDKIDRPAALLELVLRELIDDKNPDALKHHEVEHGYWNDPDYAKKQILRALDTISGFKEARGKRQIKKMAELYRKHVINYQAANKEKFPKRGQTAFFEEVGGLVSLMSRSRSYFLNNKMHSPAELVRFAVPGLINDADPDALKTNEVEKTNRNASTGRRSEIRSAGGHENFQFVVKSIVSPEHFDDNDLIEATRQIYILVERLNIRGFTESVSRRAEEMLRAKSEIRMIHGESIIDLETYREESVRLLSTAQDSANSMETAYTVGLILPEENTQYEEPSFAANFVKALDGRIGTVAVAGKVDPGLSKVLKEYGKKIRPISNGSRPFLDLEHPVIPSAVIGRSEIRKIGQGFLPVWLDLKGVDDPFVRDYGGQLQAVIVSHLAEILRDKPELINQRSELRAELLRRLAMFEGFDSLITTGERFGQTGVVISGAIAQAFLRHRAEIRLRTAA